MATKKTNAKAKKPAAKKGAAKKGAAKKAAAKKRNTANIDNCGKVLKSSIKRGSAKAAETVVDLEASAERVVKKKGSPKAKAKVARKAAKKPAKKTAAKKPAAKKSPAKKKTARKPAKGTVALPSREKATERIAKASGLSPTEVHEVVKMAVDASIKAGRHRGTGPRKKSRPLPKGQEPSLAQAEERMAREYNIARSSVRSVMDAYAQRPDYKNNPVDPRQFQQNPVDYQDNPTYTIKQTAAAIGTTAASLVVAEIVSRLLATRAGDCKDPFYGGEASARITEKSGALRLGVDFGVSILGFVGAYQLGKRGHTTAQAVTGGLATGFGLHGAYKLIMERVLPMIFKADSPDAKTFGNRVMPELMDKNQEALSKAIEAANKACSGKSASEQRLILKKIHREFILGTVGLKAAAPEQKQLQPAAPAHHRVMPQPPHAQTQSTVGVAGPVRGEPVARPRNQPLPVPQPKTVDEHENHTMGVAGCSSCSRNKGSASPVTRARSASEIEESREWFHLPSQLWYDASKRALGNGKMEGLEDAIRAGAIWYRRSTDQFLDSNNQPLRDGDQEQTSKETAQVNHEKLDSEISIPAGHRPKVVTLSDGTKKIRFEKIPTTETTAQPAAPAAQPAAPAAQPSGESSALAEIMAVLKKNESRMVALEERIATRAQEPNTPPVVEAPAPETSEIHHEEVLEHDDHEEPAKASVGSSENRISVFNLRPSHTTPQTKTKSRGFGRMSSAN